MKRSKMDILGNTQNIKSSKVIANNTVSIEYENGNKAIRLHNTDIITILPNGNKILNSGGYRTMTTKDRLNTYCPECRIYQNKGLWYMKDSSLFYDGIKIDSEGNVLSKKQEANTGEIDKIKKQITKFVSKITKDNLPIPNSGDCWLCSFEDKDGKSMGDFSNDNSHLIEHIKENYLHGSLLVNAMKGAGYTQQQIGFHYQLKLVDTFKRALRKYLQKRLLANVAVK